MSTTTNTVAVLSGRVLRAAAGFASKEASRPVLNDMRIRAGRLVACNGRLLLHLPLVDRDGDPVAPDHPDWILKTETVGAVHLRDEVMLDLLSGQVWAVRGDMMLQLPRMEQPAEANRYPDTDRVLVDEDDYGQRVAIQAPYLRALADIVEAVDEDGDTPAVVLDLPYDPNDRGVTFRVRSKGPDQPPLGMVMPLRLADPWPSVPEFRRSVS